MELLSFPFLGIHSNIACAQTLTLAPFWGRETSTESRLMSPAGKWKNQGLNWQPGGPQATLAPSALAAAVGNLSGPHKVTSHSCFFQ